jgi:hypothetical protein
VDYSDTSVVTITNSYCLGDIDGDGDVDVNGDFSLAMKLAVGQRVPTGLELMAGDIDGDGAITKADATLIKRIIQGLPINPGGGRMLFDSGLGETQEPTGYEISVGTVEAVNGEEILVPIEIDNGAGVASIGLRVTYDAGLLALQSVTNGTLTDSFAIEYVAEPGWIETVLCGGTGLPSAKGTILVLRFRVLGSRPAGTISDVTVSSLSLADEHGADLAWSHGVVGRHGRATIVLSDTLDSDHDGLSDYQEEMGDGSPSYSPWHPVNNPFGRDTDIQNPDCDEDGVSDGVEHVWGSGALNKGEFPKVDECGRKPSGDGIAIRWKGYTGSRYFVEFSDDLVVWTKLPGSDNTGSGGQVTVSDADAPPHRFYRVVAW